jgi:DNA mismatch repair protein MutS2
VDEKSLHVLEYDKITRRLADYTSFSGGRRLALDLRPAAERSVVAERLELLREAVHYSDRKGAPPLAGAHDMRDEAAAAERGRVLVPGELVDIRETLGAARRTRKALSGDPARPRLAAIAEELDDCPALFDALSSALDDEGRVVDGASRELARIRRALRVAHDRLVRTVDRLLQDPRIRDVLQEPLITQRSGRYVLPVKSAFRAKVPGVVHDTSDSGATVFVEPLAVVELGNRYRELAIEEEKEVERVLRELSGFVGAESAALADSIAGLAALDLAFACAAYGGATRATIPLLVDGPTPLLAFERARHPLLDPETVVPVDVAVGESYRQLVITGPNTGGKTVTLKTVGLLVVMAQAGLPIPAADGARLAPFDGVFADIGDEQSIEQSLSTFSGHLSNIVRILTDATSSSLVLLDELGAGTDPVEGAALAVALLDYLRARETTTVASTHYSELKAYAHATPGVMNASVEFDIESLRPTYELVIGLPGRSNALAIASRLGLPDEIVQAARAGLSSQAVAMEDLLAEIRTARAEAETERAATTALRADADRWARRLDEALAALEAERAEILAAARSEAAAELEAARRAIAALTAQAREAAALGRAADVTATADTAAAARDAVARLVETPRPRPSAPPAPDALAPGVRVRVPRYGVEGEVMDVRADGSVEIAMGALRMALPAADLEVQEGAPPPLEAPAGGGSSAPAVPLELDLRGLRVDDGLRELDVRLDRALLVGMPWVHVIHGHGTGAMKQAVREALRAHPRVRRFRAGEQGEGGDGVTVVYFD